MSSGDVCMSSGELTVASMSGAGKMDSDCVLAGGSATVLLVLSLHEAVEGSGDNAGSSSEDMLTRECVMCESL